MFSDGPCHDPLYSVHPRPFSSLRTDHAPVAWLLRIFFLRIDLMALSLWPLGFLLSVWTAVDGVESSASL